MQVVGIFIALGTAFIWGNIEKKRGAGTSSAEKIEYGGIEDEAVTDDEKNELARPKLFVFNVIVTLVVIVNLVLAKVPSYYIFMVGCAVALFVNYPGAKMQGKIIKSHAGPALTMASTILCAGVFLGVMHSWLFSVFSSKEVLVEEVLFASYSELLLEEVFFIEK